MKYIDHYLSPLGDIVLENDGMSLTGLSFSKRETEDNDLKSKTESLSIFEETKRWLDFYFSGYVMTSIPPIFFHGTDFQNEVWSILLSIPYGKTMTYGEIAKILAKRHGKEKMSSRAVGQAVGNNPIGIIVPCHRVIGAKRKMVGYAFGVDKKTRLLQLEAETLEKE